MNRNTRKGLWKLGLKRSKKVNISARQKKKWEGELDCDFSSGRLYIKNPRLPSRLMLIRIRENMDSCRVRLQTWPSAQNNIDDSLSDEEGIKNAALQTRQFQVSSNPHRTMTGAPWQANLLRKYKSHIFTSHTLKVKETHRKAETWLLGRLRFLGNKMREYAY